MPSETAVRNDVESRARNSFLSGGTNCDLDICGPVAATDTDLKRWPAKFFTQRELQAAVKDQDSRRRLLYRLAPNTAVELTQLDAEINRLDTEISSAVAAFTNIKSNYVIAAQEFENVEKARDALARFREAGSDSLAAAQGDEGRISAARHYLRAETADLLALLERSLEYKLPKIDDIEIRDAMTPLVGGFTADRLLRRYRSSLRLSKIAANRLDRLLTNAEAAAHDAAVRRKVDVQQKLIESGGTPELLNQFDALTAVASEYEAKKASLNRAKSQYASALRSFGRRNSDRRHAVKRRRVLMRLLATEITTRFHGTIRLVIDENGVFTELDSWLRSLRHNGISRWWNERSQQIPTVSPEYLIAALRSYRRRNPSMFVGPTLTGLGMSAQVAESFSDTVGVIELYQLSGIRSEDRYDIELRTIELPATYKEMGKLSGGAQVGILLSLILEADDPTPLIIDQPEDEIDKEYLFETILPALRRLKGRRQVVLATHEANIVVNGDADQVIQLKAVADAGRVAVQGVIEMNEVRDAIVSTLDGGRASFALRRAKYGF